MENISALINDLSRDPFNPLLNFAVAEEYLKLNQTASAVSFFLRCAEYGESDENCKTAIYNSLLAIAKCFDTQKGREHSVVNTLLQAITFDSDRPEAYFFLSNYYERSQQWQESYTFAVLGQRITGFNELPVNLGYDGAYCLEFQRAVAAYWIGRKEESLELFKKLANQPLLPHYAEAVKQNLEKLNALL